MWCIACPSSPTRAHSLSASQSRIQRHMSSRHVFTALFQVKVIALSAPNADLGSKVVYPVHRSCEVSSAGVVRIALVEDHSGKCIDVI